MAAKRTPPPDLPSWMTVDPDGIQPEQLGSAQMDQYQTSWGARPDNGNQSQWAEGGYWSNSRDLPIGPNSPAPSYVALQQAVGGNYNSGGGRGTIGNQSPTLGLMDGQATFRDEPNMGDRLGRGLRGAVRGINTGSTLGNVGVNVAANATGLGGANRVAGAVQGLVSDEPVNRRWTGQAADPGRLAGQSNAGRGPRTETTTTGMNFPGGGGGFSESMLGDGTPTTGTPTPPFASRGVPGGPVDPGFAANPISGRPPAAAANGLPAQKPGDSVTEASLLKDILSGGQTYQTDGSGGRRGVAGVGSGYNFAGFDFAQDPANRDVGKSAKYAFAHLASQAAKSGAPAPRTKAEAEAWFKQYVAPGMNELGFTVHKVVGDKAFISAPEHPQGAWVDFLVGADGGGATPLAWQAELGGDANANPEALFAVTGGGGGGEEFGMSRGESPGLLDSGNGALNGFAATLVNKLLQGQALEDALSESRTTRGISPASLRAVGF